MYKPNLNVCGDIEPALYIDELAFFSFLSSPRALTIMVISIIIILENRPIIQKDNVK